MPPPPAIVSTKVFEKEGVKIVLIADLRGKLTLLNELADIHNADLIIHTGNFGFLEQESVDRIHESYLRHIVEFSPLLREETILRISKLSKVTGDNVEHLSNQDFNLKILLKDEKLSELQDFIRGDYQLKIPVYTIYGMCEDLVVLNKFKHGIYAVPNLHVIDHDTLYKVNVPRLGHSILLTGIGGSLSYHKLFHQGTSFDSNDITSDPNLASIIDTNPNQLLPISGDPGNIWITFMQLGKLINTIIEYSTKNPTDYNKAIKFFITHQSPTREPILEHLSIFFKMDYTISNSLHFKYSSSYNELSINPNFESFKIKFNDSRNKLATIWKNIHTKYESMLFNLNDPLMIRSLGLALEVFDKIPITTKSSEVIYPLQLNRDNEHSTNDADDSSSSTEDEMLKTKELNSIIRQLNDLYYVSFQNSWHFNLCDLSLGQMILNLDEEGRIQMESKCEGFNFNYRLRDDFNTVRDDEADKRPVGSFRGRGKPRGRGRGRGKP
ncbi:hypothetical protein PP7435_CHR2-1054 [Komagataella phaffii CBS 7435]|uniref:DUF2433 domain-containing protein n=2 Tax=Komagataella phaffii TaxID=460519 RepID=C4R038_KOMPG|nr:Hypothetical protein PAS_chr2-1_0250 [Komagataella phaffii GS115]AOA61875.1 GQ67_00280T0 [Komagataella phaffii]CAH2448637.1 hypothetical protein BQ9382_C2-5670 [Komagataella phaffii CBS 7435]AOA67727.1 GQ68_01109T0 [Komagataella phaffii GS115]CAY68862.1 Hypothetical protein PAS_chr2-1_0250 [Komagataella phaffii GS115]CCA38731.1 hypothetical protein PP7435_CHR2-1054 [Komagataella phaffii CBS 7435]